ncbi:MAG: hypothetical protein LBU47_04960 [Christensenellaceae bacterium]|jgi:predicted RNA-binding Zn-ribbon protein involved in translation (DUF1610 family)|nr:hypothetical protein [Christensenellaceae bacterium]
MSKLTEKAAFLRGLAEGIDLKPDSPERKLLVAMLSAYEEMSQSVALLEQRLGDLEESIDEVSDDLADIEEIVYDGDEEEEDDEDEDDSAYALRDMHEEDFIEHSCPHCGEIVFFDPDDFDPDLPHPCPSCGKELFTEEDLGRNHVDGFRGEEPTL